MAIDTLVRINELRGRGEHEVLFLDRRRRKRASKRAWVPGGGGAELKSLVSGGALGSQQAEAS